MLAGNIDLWTFRNAFTLFLQGGCKYLLTYAYVDRGSAVSVLDFKSVVGGSRLSPCHRVASLDKKLYPLPNPPSYLSTQVYQMGAGDILLGVTLRWASIPSKEELQYSQLFLPTKTGRVHLFGLCVTLPFTLSLCRALETR